MTAQHVPLKPQTSGYTYNTPTESSLDSGERKTLVLEERYACIVRIIVTYISYPLLYNRLPKNFILILLKA